MCSSCHCLCALQVLIHIADAPCHGSQYHPSVGDSYPGGDPAGISHESMMAEVVRLDIQYWFGYINKQYTDQMIGIFNESLRRQSDQRLLIRQFDAVQPREVSEAVHRSVYYILSACMEPLSTCIKLQLQFNLIGLST